MQNLNENQVAIIFEYGWFIEIFNRKYKQEEKRLEINKEGNFSLCSQMMLASNHQFIFFRDSEFIHLVDLKTKRLVTSIE